MLVKAAARDSCYPGRYPSTNSHSREDFAIDTGLTVEQARTRLQAYRDRIDKIVALVPDGLANREAREHARELTKTLKADVTAYYKRPARLRESMSHTERNFFDPCMHRVFVALQKINTGTTPGAAWREAMYNADSELSSWLHNLPE